MEEPRPGGGQRGGCVFFCFLFFVAALRPKLGSMPFGSLQKMSVDVVTHNKRRSPDVRPAVGGEKKQKPVCCGETSPEL